MPLIAGNWISTVYLRYHYVVDDLAAFLLIPFVVWVVGAWGRRFIDSRDDPRG